MEQEYHAEPSKTTGALYHSVTTCVIKKWISERERESNTSWVYAQTGITKSCPSPKSASLISS